LRIGDFLEVEVDNENKRVEFMTIPTLIRVRKGLSKAGHQYLTFPCGEGCRYLKEYWEYRMQHGEVLTLDSAAVKARKFYGKKQFIRTTNTGDKIKNGIRAAGFEWRPYVLRCYFRYAAVAGWVQGSCDEGLPSILDGPHVYMSSSRLGYKVRMLP